jgi:hypothetical protein
LGDQSEDIKKAWLPDLTQVFAAAPDPLVHFFFTNQGKIVFLPADQLAKECHNAMTRVKAPSSDSLGTGYLSCSRSLGRTPQIFFLNGTPENINPVHVGALRELSYIYLEHSDKLLNAARHPKLGMLSRSGISAVEAMQQAIRKENIALTQAAIDGLETFEAKRKTDQPSRLSEYRDVFGQNLTSGGFLLLFA